MPWSSAPRTASSKRTGTRAWRTIRAAILERDGWQCTRVTDEVRCTEPAEQVDHVMPVAKGGTDDPGNLASLCLGHHAPKIQAEAATARAARSPRRAPQRHPGLIG